jgi:hypothetical protein
MISGMSWVAGGVKQQEHAQQEAEVAHPVGDERLLAGVGVGRLAVPETDQQVAAQADALPADEHHRQGIAQHQHEHGAAEEVEVREEPGVVLSWDM